jgi:hypothetical protein
MEIISYFGGFTQLNTSWDEIRPIKGIPNQILAKALAEEFSFEQVGISPSTQQTGMYLPSFGQGRYIVEDTLTSINSLDFQPDRIVVACSTTEQSDLFIDKLSSFLKIKLGFRIPEKNRPRKYQSTIVSDLGVEFVETLGKWQNIAEFYNKFNSKKESNIVPLSLRFGQLGLLPTDNEFTIEKRFSAPEGERWIFTQANLTTSDHEKLLHFIAKQFSA